MMLQSQQFDFECKFRHKDTNRHICSYQSIRLGHLVGTSYLFCNNCPKNVYLDEQQDDNFIKKCFHRRYDKHFISEVIDKYSKQTTIIVPKIWKTVDKTFINLKNQDWVKDIGLTGSIIVDGVSNHKDIDIVIYIKDINKYIEWKTTNDLPSHIDTLKIDYYIYIDPMVQFFTSLWPNSNRIIMNEQFSNNITIPKNYSIIYNNFDFNLYQ